MLRHIFTIIYNQRKQNIFIFLELLLVACLLWAISDSLCVDIYTEKQPMGVDIESVYELHLSVANEAALEDSSGYRRVAEDFLKLVDNVRQCPEVEAASVSMSAVPYTWTSNWSYLIAASDTTTPSDLCQMFFVMPEYFQVLHIQTPEGRPVCTQSGGVHPFPNACRETLSRGFRCRPGSEVWQLRRRIGNSAKDSFGYSTSPKNGFRTCRTRVLRPLAQRQRIPRLVRE